MRAAASRWVNASPRPQVFRSVAISDVWRYSSLYTEPELDPGRDDDGGDAVARAVEREAELARRCGRVGRRDRTGGDVIVGSARLIPADQQSVVFQTFVPDSDVADR